MNINVKILDKLLYATSLSFQSRWSIKDFTNKCFYIKRYYAHSTVDKNDMFQADKTIINEFWDAEGPFKPLHSLNYIRLPFIRDGLVKVAPDEKISTCLKEKKILDVGCGGGVLSEGLSKYGAKVTGIDSSEVLIKMAQHHSSKNKRLENNLPTYVMTTIEEHSNKFPEYYDAIVVSEVIEHVAEKEFFVECCARSVRPGGKLFFTTPSRTRMSQLIVIFAFENILNSIPKGTHEYSKFMRPCELKHLLEMNDCRVISTKGCVYYPLANYWQWTNHKLLFFAMEAVKST